MGIEQFKMQRLATVPSNIFSYAKCLQGQHYLWFHPMKYTQYSANHLMSEMRKVLWVFRCNCIGHY